MPRTPAPASMTRNGDVGPATSISTVSTLQTPPPVTVSGAAHAHANGYVNGNGNAHSQLNLNGIPHQEIQPSRLLLSPADVRTPTGGHGSGSGSGSGRPSSRRTLTRALELAREAVQLDSRMDDPHGAIVAYGRSVSLLQEVMHRVMAGEDSTESRRRNGRRRSVVAQEEEIRRLKAIVGLSHQQQMKTVS
jgi:hypothetical protein